MRILLPCAALLLTTVFSAPALANDAAADDSFPGSFTGNVAIVSEYSFRGIAQSDENPALQGGLDYGASLGDTTPAFTWAYGAATSISMTAMKPTWRWTSMAA